MSQVEEEERPNVEYGDREAALANEILRTTVGSGLHGIEIAGTDDNDEMGVYIEPPVAVLGVTANWNETYRDTYTSRTKPEGMRSGPGDTDLVIYGLRKYLRLAVKGNPTVLLPLYAPQSQVLVETDKGTALRSIRSAFLSEHAVNRFLQYMDAQQERMLGYGKRNNVPNRPELIEKYGFDVKYAAHALRLAHQGYEVASSGHLTLPLPDAQRELVLSVKRGEIELESVSRQIDEFARKIIDLQTRKKLAVPEKPNFDIINDFATWAHHTHWNRTE